MSADNIVKHQPGTTNCTCTFHTMGEFTFVFGLCCFVLFGLLVCAVVHSVVESSTDFSLCIIHINIVISLYKGCIHIYIYTYILYTV